MFTKNDLPDIEIREKKVQLWKAWADAPEGEESDAAEKAYDECDPRHLWTVDDGDWLVCSACDAPVFEDDEVVEDPDTGEVFLRVAIGLPPRAKVDEGQLLPDAEVA